MASFEIILGMAPGEPGVRARSTDGASGELLDVVVDGERFSAATRPEQAACLLRDIVSAAAAVLEGRAAKALVPLCDAPLELCLVANGPAPLVSLYRTGPSPEVRLLDRPVPAADLLRQARAALPALGKDLSEEFSAELTSLIARLARAVDAPAPAPAASGEAVMRWRSSEAGPVRIALEAVLPAAPGAVGATVRADLHALLFRGRVSFGVRGQHLDFSPGFVFLQVERLLSLCRPLHEASTARRAAHLRAVIGGTTVGVRLGTDGKLALSLGRTAEPTFTAPALDPREFIAPVIEAALALARDAVRADRSRGKNLRLRTLRSEARALRKAGRLDDGTHGKLNDDPGLYRASAVPVGTAEPRAAGGMNLGASTRLRYAQRWRAEIEGIDLSGTLLCGDRLVVPGVREVYALDRRTGGKFWSRALPRAAMTLAGGDILRLSSRGDVEVRDVRDGECLWTTRIAPRVGAPALAVTFNAAGLPPVVLLAEGERRLVALDLRTGEARWRHTFRHGGAFKIRRVGRLAVVVSGDTAVTALDVATGEVVWRFVGPSPFVLAPAVHRDTVIASAGVPGRSATQLFGIDAFSGALRWTVNHAASSASVPVGAAEVAAIAVAGRDGAQLLGYDLQTGASRFAVSIGSTAAHSPVLALSAFDDLLVANVPTGRVAAIDASRGELRWTRVLGAPVADDTPRRLDAQLRAGALFVPQSSLAVLRPRDGATVANVESCDLVPDLLRIDEECALYVGEESGHLGCYELGARLSVVSVLN